MARGAPSATKSKGPYSRVFVADVVREFKIPPRKATKLRLVLNKAAWMYRLTLGTPTWDEQRLTTRKALERVEAAYVELVRSLSSLRHPARDRLWDPAFDDPIRRRLFDAMAQLDPNNYPHEREFLKILDAFGERIHVRLSDYPKVQLQGGRPRLQALHNWTGMIARFFTDELGLKFAYSEMSGQPKSRAYDFCWHVLRQIDPKVTPAQLKTAMRYAVKPRVIPVFVYPPQQLVTSESAPDTTDTSTADQPSPKSQKPPHS